MTNQEYDLDALSRRLTEELANIRQQKVIKKIVDLINKEYLEIKLYLFGGAVRDTIANERIRDRDILIVGDDTDRYTIKLMLRRLFKKNIQLNGGYFGNGNKINPNLHDIMEFQNCDDFFTADCWIDFVFIDDISDIHLDFDVNGVYVEIGAQEKYTWKDILTGNSNCLNHDPKRLTGPKGLFQSVVEKKCIPTPYMLDFLVQSDVSFFSNHRLRNVVHLLYRFTKMMGKGYKIENANYELIICKAYMELKEAITWHEAYYNSEEKQDFDKMSEVDQTNHILMEQSSWKIHLIKSILKKWCLDRMVSIAIGLLPLRLPIYVQLWMIEFECPISACINELDRIRCLEGVRNSYNSIMESHRTF